MFQGKENSLLTTFKKTCTFFHVNEQKFVWVVGIKWGTAALNTEPNSNSSIFSHKRIHKILLMTRYFFKENCQGKTELLEYFLIDLQQHLVTVIKAKLVLLDLLLISLTDSRSEKRIPCNLAQP